MAAKNFTMKNYNGTAWEDLHPKTNMDQVEGLNVKIDEIDAIAKGASRAKVFDTVAELDAWLAVADNKATLRIGDNFLIKAKDVPDYWWDGTAKQELETSKVTLELATASKDGLMAKGDKSKLDGIATGATKVTVPSDIGAATAAQGAKADTALQSVPFETAAANIKAAGTAAAGSSGKVADAAHIHPAQTTVSGNAGTATKLAAAKTFELTGDVTGSVSSDLSGNVSITATQVANKSNQKVGVSKNSVTVAGTRKQINFKDGSNVTVTVADNAANDAVDVTIASANTTYSDATTAASGLMSAADKTKLNGVAASAQVNVIEAIQKNGVAVAPSGKTVNITMAKADVGLGNVQNIDTTNAANISSGTLPAARLPVATASVNGAMSGADKSKLDAMLTVTVSATSPASQKTGDLWYDLSNS